MIANCGVGIVPKNVDHVIAGIPAGRDRIPKPDQVSQLVNLSIAFIHEAIERFAALGAIGAPPEPTSLGLVEWSPEHWNISSLKTEKLFSNYIHVTKQESVVSAACVCESGSQVECCPVSVESLPPWNGCIVYEIAATCQTNSVYSLIIELTQGRSNAT